MAITASAKKALRQSKRRRSLNIKKKKTIKVLLKEVQTLISGNKAEEAKKLLPKIYKALDKACKANILKKNMVSRKKSRITKLIQKKK